MEQNEISKSNKTKLFVLTMLILLVSVAGISYAYFTINIVGNEEASSLRVKTANLSLVYNDVQIVSDEYIEPGWTDTKVLTVYNDGNVDAPFIIKFRELTNTIINGELVLSATCTTPNGVCDNLPERAVHSASTEITDAYMYGPITIPVGATYTYTLRVKFKETGSDQNYNQSKNFIGTLNIGDGTPTDVSRFTYTLTGDSVTYTINTTTCQNEYVSIFGTGDPEDDAYYAEEGANYCNRNSGESVTIETDLLGGYILPEDYSYWGLSNVQFQNECLIIDGYSGGTDVIIPSTIDNKPVCHIQGYTFRNKQITSVVIPSGVTSIGTSAFENNQLTSVVIPNGVTSIGSNAFDNNQITSIVIPNGVTSIGTSAFRNNNLTSAVIPNTITSISHSAFSNNQLASVVIPSGVTSIGTSAFENNQLTSVVISNTVTSIGSNAFSSNQLASLTIPNSVTDIGQNAFRNNQIKSLVIPNSVTYIGYNAFQNNHLTSLTIGTGITTLGNYIFYDNYLTSVTIPSNITRIQQYAFNGSDAAHQTLESVRIEGKTSSSNFSYYGNNLWGWKSGITCTTDNTSNVTNGCIKWDGPTLPSLPGM